MSIFLNREQIEFLKMNSSLFFLLRTKKTLIYVIILMNKKLGKGKV